MNLSFSIMVTNIIYRTYGLWDKGLWKQVSVVRAAVVWDKCEKEKKQKQKLKNHHCILFYLMAKTFHIIADN